MGKNTRYDPEHQRREQVQQDAYRRDMILREQLRDTLLTALATGPDAVYAVQRAAGHDLARLGLLAPGLRVVSSQGEPADVQIEVVPPEVVVDPHATESTELLRIVRARLLEDGTILQAERLELVRLMRLILERLGQMTGRN